MMQQEWAQLERMLKKVGFGEVFNLRIEHGKPRLDHPLHYRSSVLLKPDESDRSRPKDGDGLRDGRFRDLIRFCEQRGDIVIKTLIIQDSLPHRIEIEGELSPQ